MGEGGNDRIEELEARLERLEEKIDRLITTSPPAAVPPPPAPQPQPAPATPASAPARPKRDFAFDSETALKWGGVALVVLALGFAVSTAINRGWIGPDLQLVGAVGFSLALVGAGLRLRPTRMPWTHALCVGGVAALFTTFASDLFIDRADVGAAYVCTIGVGLIGFVLARFVPSEWVGVVTLLGGGIGWVVIGFDDPLVGASLGALALAATVAIALSIEQNWFTLRLLALASAMLGLLILAGISEAGAEQVAVVAVTAAVWVAILRIPSIGDLQEVSQQLEVQLAAAAAPFAFAVVTIATDVETDTAAGSIAIGAAGVTALAATLQPRLKLAHFVSLLLGASVALSIGLAIVLSTEAAFVAIAVQGAGLVVLSRALDNNIRVLLNGLILLAIAAVYALSDGIDAWNNDAPIGADIARIAIVAAVAVGIHQTRQGEFQLIGAFSVLGLVLIWLGSVLVHLPEGQAAVSVSWAIVGMGLFIAGALRKVPILGTAGLAVLALTVAKLLAVDMTEVDTLWRAGLFLLVGLALMRLGFLLPRLTGKEPAGEAV